MMEVEARLDRFQDSDSGHSKLHPELRVNAA